eukprot:scaffold117407_cov33-Tisochrysis_lutea.AAC.1
MNPGLSSLLSRLVIAPYSVLGQQMVPGKGVVEKASRPDQTIAFCDPAGLPFIQHYGPQMAGGASGALYAFLGIRDSEAFPDPVRQAVTTIASAKYHQYGMLHCIHTVGPNFNMGKEDGTQYTREVRLTSTSTLLPRPCPVSDALGLLVPRATWAFTPCQLRLCRSSSHRKPSMN